MNAHLTEKQISRWIAGNSTDEEQRHARDCARCAAKLSSFQNALWEFRDSVTYFANQQRAGTVRHTVELLGALRHARLRSVRWLAVAAAMAIVVAIPVYKKSMESIERAREAQAARESQLDAQLLERVNAHLSQTAPASLQPLMEMLSNANGAKKEGGH